MNTSITSNWRPLLRAVSAFLIALIALAAPARAQQLFIAHLDGYGGGIVSQYNSATGAVENASLITAGLNQPIGLAVHGNDLYVANQGNGGTIGHFILNGPTVPEAGSNPTFITKVGKPTGLALSVNGDTLYVSDFKGGTVTAYSLSGPTPVAKFSIPLTRPAGLTVQNQTLYVASAGSVPGLGTVGTYYAKTGVAMNASFVSKLNGPTGVAVQGSTLYVATQDGVVNSYDINGTNPAQFDRTVVTGLSTPTGLAVSGDTLYVADSAKSNVTLFGVVGTDPVVISPLSFPTGVAVK
jgi:6-phosphogluconolactonase (cycloisomerase 2 family)